MGTKNRPGNFDCYAKADPDEPLFVLRGKDVSAPYLVDIWTAMRRGNFMLARSILDAMVADRHIEALVGECEKFDEARSVAEAMRDWRKMLDERGGDRPTAPKAAVEAL